VSHKPHRPEPSAKNERDEYATFETSLQKILSVPRSTVQAKISDEHRARNGGKRTSRDSRGKD